MRSRRAGRQRREHGRAAGQERRAVQDGKAQPGGGAGQPQPARGTGARDAHHGSSDAVAALPDGLDHRRVAELGPEPADGGLHGAGERVGRFVPYPFKQFLGGDRPPVRGEQAFKHGEFLGGQRQATPGADRDAACRIQAQVTVFESGGQRGGGAPAQGPDAGHQLGEIKRLGQVVIGAQVEALDPFPDRPGRGEHQHPGRGPAVGQGAADVVAGHARQVAVEHHHVIAVDREVLQGRVAVQRHVDGHSLPAQPGRHRRGQDLVVLGHQNPHRLPASSRAATACRPPASRIAGRQVTAR